MNKLIPPLGIVGTGIVAGGGYLFSHFSQDYSFSQKQASSVKFKEKYGKYILSVIGVKDSGIWDKKLSLLKSGNPKHPDLKNAAKNSDKSLLQKGCQKIYDSSYEEGVYFEDFKSYCARLFEDVFHRSWNDEESTDSRQWDGSLKLLKEQGGNLVSEELKELMRKLTSGTDTFSEDERKTLKDWCHLKRWDFSVGEEASLMINEIDRYCTH